MSDPLSEAFIEHCRNERQPPNTIASRTRTLRSVGNAGTATREEIEAWWQTRADLAIGSRVVDMSNLRVFYRWCQTWEHRADDPTLRIKPPKTPKGIARPLSRADLLALLDALPDDLRRALCLGAYGGFRVSEAAALDWADVDEEANRIYVMDSKGGKSRVVKVSAGLIDHLLPRGTGNVVTGGTDRYSAAGLQRKINRAIQRIAPGVTFHQARHRYGVKAYQATGDLLAVGEQMGHSSPVTTSVYAKASSAVADRIAEAVMR